VDLSSKQGLFISALLHAALFLAVLILGLVASFRNKPEELHIFSLVAAPNLVMENETSLQPEPPQRMSYDTFVQEFGKPTRQKLQEPVRKPVTVPKLDTRQLVENLGRLLIDDPEQLSAESLSNADRQALNRYIAVLKNALNRAWDKPEGLGGQPLEAIARFIVEPDGSITAPSLALSSGNVMFDKSVLSAFTKVRGVGPTPGRTTYRLSLTFRMVD